MDIGRALTFFTEEERWIEKTAIGALVLLLSSLLSFVLVGALGFFIVMGYSVRLMRNVQQGVRPVLPEWDQWGEDLVRGLKLFVVGFVWALPIILVFLPVLFGSIMVDQGGAAEGFGVMLILCGTCLSLIYGLFIALAQPGFTIAFARDEKISSGLQFTPIWQWTRAHLSDVVIVAIVYVVGGLIIGTVAGIAGAILCGIGLLVTLPLGQLVIYYFQYHLFGQLPPDVFAPAYSRGAAYDADFGTPVAPVAPVAPAVTTPVEPEAPLPPVEDAPSALPPADRPADDDRI
ncbi:MAG: DUF4013 domain-containing protein [Caldilineaceae bacterium]|nr:DUF4013 domain-containing protein [Caldilineaceae bacterium]